MIKRKSKLFFLENTEIGNNLGNYNCILLLEFTCNNSKTYKTIKVTKNDILHNICQYLYYSLGFTNVAGYI